MIVNIATIINYLADQIGSIVYIFLTILVIKWVIFMEIYLLPPKTRYFQSFGQQTYCPLVIENRPDDVPIRKHNHCQWNAVVENDQSDDERQVLPVFCEIVEGTWVQDPCNWGRDCGKKFQSRIQKIIGCKFIRNRWIFVGEEYKDISWRKITFWYIRAPSKEG